MPFSSLRAIFLLIPLNYLANVVKRAEYSSRLAGYFFMLLLIADWALWNTVPLRHFNQNKEAIMNKTVMLESVMHLVTPFDYKYNIVNWAIMYALGAYLGFSGCIIIVTFNVLSFIFVFHLIGHVQILKHRFRTEFENTLSDQETEKKLITLIKHHNFIIQMFEDTQKAFGYNVSANYCHNLLCDSLLMYEIMFAEKKEAYVLMFTVFLGGLILLSLVLEEIRRESDDLADVIYNIPWEEMSVSNQKTVMMILARSQPPLEFIAAGGLRAGVRPAISILKSTFSYYVMLKTSINGEE
ncbi:odorant receptor 30a-like [Battus philenor]|uniref:odorant receptor 30a-like n=1 Tax=Battus philenor TaxID=42288 RepID=UPI0035CFBE4A